MRVEECLMVMAFLIRGSLRKDKLNVVDVMFLVGHSFRKRTEMFINVENALS